MSRNCNINFCDPAAEIPCINISWRDKREQFICALACLPAGALLGAVVPNGGKLAGGSVWGAVTGGIGAFIITLLSAKYEIPSFSPAVAQEVYTGGTGGDLYGMDGNSSDTSSVMGNVYNYGSFPAEPWIGGYVIKTNKIFGKGFLLARFMRKHPNRHPCLRQKLGSMTSPSRG